MKIRFSDLILIIPALLLLSCDPPPELSSTPVISFDDVVFKEGVTTAGGQQVDSLIFSINFEDNEGDLGLTRDDLEDQFQQYIFPMDDNGNYIRFGSSEDLPEFNCYNWLINPVINGDTIPDTIYVEINPDHYNIEIDFFIKRDGVYSEYDFRKETCIPYDARFPPLNTREDDRPLQGVLIYGIQDAFGGFRRAFRNDTLRVNIQIKDRALNRSNVAESPEFTLNSILAN